MAQPPMFVRSFRKPSRRIWIAVAALCVVGAAIGWFMMPPTRTNAGAPVQAAESAPRGPRSALEPTPAQWATLTLVPVQQQVFRELHQTEGKIAVDEDHSTLIYSPYSGRVKTLLVKPGDKIEAGQPLFVIEATDAVQVHNDFIAAIGGVNKATSQLNLARTVETRNRELYQGKAIALKELQQSQVDLIAAQNDMNAAEAALDATRNRLRILGRTDAEIASLQEKRAISPETPIFAPISGTIVQRKVGPGQYITSGSSDPAFIVGDLSTVWLLAYVRESEASRVQIGQPVSFTTLAYPDRVFTANINYVATALDMSTRRLLVRANINNAGGLLKPEMFASVSIMTGEGDTSIAVPRDSIIYEADTARVWASRDGKTVELRRITPGLLNGNMVQVLDGLQPTDKVVTRGSLFIDRIASGT